MSIKWAVGAVAAVVTALFVLPGIASAHEVSVSGEASCRDAGGVWSVDWTIETTIVEDDDRVVDLDFDINDGGVAPSLGLGDFDPSLQDFGETSGSATTTYGPGDDPHTSEHGANNVDEFTANVEYIEWADGYDPGGPLYGVSNIVTQPGYCIESTCVDGDNVDVPVNELVNTGDCGFINVCIGGVNGEVERISEFDAEQQGLEEGECEREDPPEITPEPEPEEPVEEVEDAVLEVAPVEEVAALPAAGYGDSAVLNLTWIAVIGAALLTLGGTTALMARPRK
jgi:hypothetical protein